MHHRWRRKTIDMNTRRNFIRQTTLAAGAFSMVSSFKSIASIPGGDWGNSKSLTLLHTGNLHLGAGTRHNLGLIAEQAKALRHQGLNLLLVNSGNALNSLQGDPAAQEHCCRRIKQAGYQALAAGTADLNIGADQLAAMAANFRLNFMGQSSAPLPTYRVVQKGAIKTGIIALPAQRPVFSSSAAIAAGLTATAEMLKKEKHCQLILCLSPATGEKLAFQRDIAIVSKTNHIDIFISSSHSKKLSRTIRNQANHEVLVATSGNNGAAIGRIDLTFNEALEKTGVRMSKVLF